MSAETILLIQAAAGFALLGVIWVVQLVVYPAFRMVRPEDLLVYHRAHVRHITPVVAPLMLAELGSGLWLLLHPDLAPPLQPAAFVCTVTVWLSTFLIQVPLHHRLERGFDGPLIERLIATNWIRTAAWTAKAALVAMGWPG